MTTNITKYTLDLHHHMTVRSAGDGRISYIVWRSHGTESRTKLFSTSCRTTLVDDAIEHAREELRIWVERRVPCAACREIDASGLSYQEHTCGKPALPQPGGHNP